MFLNAYFIASAIYFQGDIAYVPQQPWILNRTLKQNILLFEHMNENKYNKILDLCCLRPDLDILPAGDETEIGEKVNSYLKVMQKSTFFFIDFL